MKVVKKKLESRSDFNSKKAKHYNRGYSTAKRILANSNNIKTIKTDLIKNIKYLNEGFDDERTRDVRRVLLVTSGEFAGRYNF